MGAIPDDISDLFPLRVRPPGDDRRLRILYVVGNPKDEIAEDDDPDDGAALLNAADMRRLSLKPGAIWRSLPEQAEHERPIVQEVPWRRDYGAKAHGRSGCITRLKRALEALRGGKWTNTRIVDEMKASGWRFEADDHVSIARQLSRLEAGTHRVDEMLVVAIARTLAVELDDLVFTHEVFRGEDRAGQGNPIAALAEERDAKFDAALRRYDVTLAPLVDDESYSRLAKDIADPAIAKGWRHPYRNYPDDVPRHRWPEALRRLQGLLLDKKAPVDRLAAELQAVVGALDQCDLRVGVGRHIRVVGLADQYTNPPPGDPVRRVTVVVSAKPGDTLVHVDLLSSSRNRPTWREERLDEGDLSVVPEIRSDIAWCGHWEGRWFRALPLDAPDWLWRAAERRAGV